MKRIWRVIPAAVVPLALIAVARAGGFDPWPMKPVVVAPSEFSNPLVRALSRVANYDIYRDHVIVQATYSRKKELTIIFFAEEDAGKRRPAADRPQWEIQVLFGRDYQTRSPKVVARNISRMAKGRQTTERIRLGEAVAVAVSSWDAERTVDLPLIIQADKEDLGYGGIIWRLPETPGGFVGFDVSGDLKRYRITPGH